MSYTRAFLIAATILMVLSVQKAKAG